jgi:hypothetical protein
MLGDGADKIAAKPKEKKPWAERFEELARIANKQGTKGLEMEGNKVVRREGI